MTKNCPNCGIEMHCLDMCQVKQFSTSHYYYFDTYICPTCGRSEFYSTGESFKAIKTRYYPSPKTQLTLDIEDLENKYGSYTKHPEFQKFIRQDISRKYLSKEDQSQAFINFLQAETQGNEKDISQQSAIVVELLN